MGDDDTVRAMNDTSTKAGETRPAGPLFIIDASRSWPALHQPAGGDQFVRTVFGQQDMEWAFRVAQHANVDSEIRFLYDELHMCYPDEEPNTCLYLACAEQVAKARFFGYRVETVYVGCRGSAASCFLAHLDQRSKVWPVDTDR